MTYAYGMPQWTFREYHSELEDISSSYDDGLRKTNLAKEKKIVELSSQVKVAHARQKRFFHGQIYQSCITYERCFYTNMM